MDKLIKDEQELIIRYKIENSKDELKTDRIKLLDLYIEVFGIIDSLYAQNDNDFIKAVNLKQGFTLIKEFTLFYKKDILEKEIENMSNIIKSMRKINMLQSINKLYFYLYPNSVQKGTKIVIDTCGEVLYHTKRFDVTIPNSWKNIDFDYKFKKQTNEVVLFREKNILVLRIKSLEQLAVSVDTLNRLMEENILKLYVNGEHRESLYE